MKPDKSKIIREFRKEKNCSQSVLLGFSGAFHLKDDVALSISSGFGAGMGRMQKTCGAVTGAYMVIGLYAGSRSVLNSERKEISYTLIQEFTRRFEEKKGTSVCSDLIHCNLNTEEGKKYFEANKMKENVCEKCIQFSINILDELLEDEK